MIPLKLGERDQLRWTAEGSMGDMCQILVYGSTVDPFGEPIEGWTPGLVLPCGYNPTRSRERNGEEGDNRVITDAEIRLPLAAQGAIKPVDRIKLTHRYGTPLERTPIFEVVGEPIAGPSALVAQVQEVRL